MTECLLCQGRTVKLSAVPPCFTKRALLRYLHISDSLRLPYVAEYSEKLPLPLAAPSAVHLLNGVSPESQRLGLSVQS